MKKYHVKVLSFILPFILFTGCGADETVQEEAASPSIVSITEVSTVQTTVPEVTEESISISFAKTEAEYSETEETVSDKEEEFVCAENQLWYEDRNISVLMEFTGVDDMQYYPRASVYYYQNEDSVLHSRFTVTNKSSKEFDFAPWRMIIYGSNKNSRWSMLPNVIDGLGLECPEISYRLKHDESITVNLDFIGEKGCIEYADEITYSDIKSSRLDTSDMVFKNKNIPMKIHIDNRHTVKKAVSAALETAEEEVKPLAAEEGEYSVLTPKNSYCFSVENINDGTYVKVALRVQNLTGESQIFEPMDFRLYLDGDDMRPGYYGFDEELVSKLPEEYEIAGVDKPVYGYPFGLYTRSDGSAEYELYFFTANDDVNDVYKFGYEGENDTFDIFIKVS